MQSCLTLARAYYQANQKKIEAYISNHPAVTNPAAAGSEKQMANILTSKINAALLIQCEKKVSVLQVLELQKYKQKFDQLDYTKNGFKQLVDIDLLQYDVKE